MDTISTIKDAVECITTLKTQLNQIVESVNNLQTQLESELFIHDLNLDTPSEEEPVYTYSHRVNFVLGLYEMGYKYEDIAKITLEKLQTVKNMISRFGEANRYNKIPNLDDQSLNPGDLKRQPRNQIEAEIVKNYLEGMPIKDMLAKFNLTQGQLNTPLYSMVVPNRGPFRNGLKNGYLTIDAKNEMFLQDSNQCAANEQKDQEATLTLNGKKAKQCPHCKKIGVSSHFMNHWHFDNCKQNPKNTKKLNVVF